MKKPVEELVDDLTLEEQVSLLSGQDFWSVNAIERLSIGALRVTDGPNGARGARGSGGLLDGAPAASFPVGIAIGASWDPDLAGQIGSAIADEVKSKGAHVSLAPTVNIQRSVTNGRNFECYSEDPELTAALAVEYIKGLQDKNISATIKHFVGNESEIERTTMSSQIDERSLREVYFRPFEDAVKIAGTWGVMTSYNRLNGTFTSEHDWLLKDILRGDWKFDGAVMSDWFGSHSTAPTMNAGLDLEMPGPARDRGEKLVAAVEAGEVSRSVVRERALNILKLMEKTGSIDDLKPHEEFAIDLPEHRALIRKAGAAGSVLLKNEGGLLPLAVEDFAKDARIAVIGPNAKEARIMGGGSAQLTPHYQVSPWDGLVARVGENVLGFEAGCTNHRYEALWRSDIKVEFFNNQTLSGDPVHVTSMEQAETFWQPPVADGKVDPRKFSARLTGSYVAGVSGLHRFGIHAAGFMKLFVDGELVADAHTDWSRGRTFFEDGCDPVVGEKVLEAGRSYDITLEFVSNEHAQLVYAAFRAGIGVAMGEVEIARAVELAKQSDIALVFVGRSGEWDTEGSDLENITLPGAQDELVARVAAANSNTIVVLQTGGPVEMPWIDQVPVVLEAWYPGQEAGNAIADMLFGDVEPSGRLAQTFPAKWRDNPTWSQDAEIYPGLDGKVRYEEGVFVGYRHYHKTGTKPMFPFGFGLSYTRFEMSDLSATAKGSGATATLTLTNVGDRKGSTVVQIYVGDRDASVERPARELKAFQKVELDAGESRELQFELSPRDFAFFDISERLWRVEEGLFIIEAGFSADDIKADATLTIASATMAP